MVQSLDHTAEYICVIAIPMPGFRRSVGDVQFADEDE